MAEDTAYQRPPVGGGPARPLPDRPGTVVPPRAMRARRRRPAMLALAVALIAAGGLGGAALYTATGQRVAVLALARDVPSGATITADDLTEARIDLDPALKPLSVQSKVVNMRATTDLKAGQLLTGSDVTNAPLVQPGQQVVGVAAKAGQLPAKQLQPGQSVLLVSTPGSPSSSSGSSGAGKSSGSSAPISYAATVVFVGPADSSGQTVVDVAVPSGQGPAVAGLVAGGAFAVVVTSEMAGSADSSGDTPSSGTSALSSGSPSAGTTGSG
jgi:hypothetical protein